MLLSGGGGGWGEMTSRILRGIQMCFNRCFQSTPLRHSRYWSHKSGVVKKRNRLSRSLSEAYSKSPAVASKSASKKIDIKTSTKRVTSITSYHATHKHCFSCVDINHCQSDLSSILNNLASSIGSYRTRENVCIQQPRFRL